MREERKLRVFENKILRKIFGTRIDGIARKLRKLQSAKLHALHSSRNIIRNLKSRRLTVCKIHDLAGQKSFFDL